MSFSIKLVLFLYFVAFLFVLIALYVYFHGQALDALVVYSCGLYFGFAIASPEPKLAKAGLGCLYFRPLTSPLSQDSGLLSKQSCHDDRSFAIMIERISASSQ